MENRENEETNTGKSLTVTNGKQRQCTDKYRKIMSDWNYDRSCMVSSLTVWDFENFTHLILDAQSTINSTLRH